MRSFPVRETVLLTIIWKKSIIMSTKKERTVAYEEKKDRHHCLCGTVGADPAVLPFPVRDAQRSV